MLMLSLMVPATLMSGLCLRMGTGRLSVLVNIEAVGLEQIMLFLTRGEDAR